MPRLWILKASGSLLILGFILWLLPIGDVWAALQRVPFSLWLIVFAAFLIGHVICALKWWLLAIRGSGVSFPLALRAHYSGLAANLCLPGIAGGDVVRAALVLNKTHDKARLALGSLADRLIDTFGLLLLTLLGSAFIVARDGSLLDLPLKIGLVMTGALAVCLLILGSAHRLPFERFIEKGISALDQIRRRPGALLLCISLSIGVQAMFISLTMVFAHAVGVHVEAAVWFFAWPLAKLLSLLPISISGIGVREAGLAALMAPFGANAPAVVAVGLIWQTVLFAAGVVGGLALLISKGVGGLRSGRSAAFAVGQSKGSMGSANR